MTFMTNCFQQRFAPIAPPTIGLTLNDLKVTVAGTEIGNNERMLQCMGTMQVPFTLVKLPSQIGNMQLPYTPVKLPPLRSVDSTVVKNAHSPPEFNKYTQKEDEDFRDMPELTPSPDCPCQTTYSSRNITATCTANSCTIRHTKFYAHSYKTSHCNLFK